MRGLSPLCKAGCLAGGLIVLFGLIPLAYGSIQIGMIVLLLYGAVLFLVCRLWDAFTGWPVHIRRRLREVSDRRGIYVPRWWRRLRRLICIGLAAFALIGGAVSARMAWAAWGCSPAPDAAVVVLGCQTIDGQPSRMLRYRLEAAYGWLQTHPDAIVVCSGGKGQDEQASEAAVMRDWLVEKGVPAEQIYLEEMSHSTAENIVYSAQILQENGYAGHVALTTDGFHQLRAQIYARKNQLSAGAIPSKTPWGLAPSYWVREWFGLAKALFLD